MAGFADLVLKASGTAGGRLADVNLDGTEGRTWRWTFDDVTDATGADVDLTSATGVCKILDDVDGAEVLALTFTGGVGTFTLEALSSATAGLATGATGSKARSCVWSLKVTSGANVVQFWGPSGSRFRIYPE